MKDPNLRAPWMGDDELGIVVVGTCTAILAVQFVVHAIF